MRPEESVVRVMTEAVVVIEADRPVSEALACFLQYPIHHLPVVREGRAVGMLSSTDLLKIEYFAPRGAADRASFLDARFSIEQIMRQPVTTCVATASLGEVCNLMIEAGIHALPIVDDEGRISGIVTSTDIIRSLLYGPPRRGAAVQGLAAGTELPQEGSQVEHVIHRKPAPEEYGAALKAAATLHAAGRDDHFLGKTLLYLDQRRANLEKVMSLADRYLTAGQDESNHALLLKAVLAAKGAEEQAAGTSRMPFPLD